MKYLLIICVLMFAGCNPPQGTHEKIFTDESGNTIHKFYDRGRWHYYVVPNGQTNSDHKVGKCRYEETIQTVEQ